MAGYRRLGRPFRTNIVTSASRPPKSPGADTGPPTGGGEAAPPAFALSPDGSTLAAARPDGRVDLIDAETLRRTGGFEAFAGRPALAIEYSPDGRVLAVAGGGGGVGLWDAGSGKRVGPLLRAPRGPARATPRSCPTPNTQPPRRPSARLRPGRAARRGRAGRPRGWGGRRADLGSRRAEADRPATAPAGRM